MHAPLRALSALGAVTFMSACAVDTMGGMDDGQMAQASAGTTVMVGGAAMYPTRNIVENAVNSNDHTTLVAAVKAAGLVDTLSAPGPFTFFAPTNAAFDRLPAGTVATLLEPENKGTLTRILTYHVIPGRITAQELTSMIASGGGSARLTTVPGGTLTARRVAWSCWSMPKGAPRPLLRPT